jgi:hypothetical protein
MDGKNENNEHDDVKSKDEELKKQLEKLTVCPYCQSTVELVWIHGHYQCPVCKNIIVGCCGDQ